jgi:hypothetical protein
MKAQLEQRILWRVASAILGMSAKGVFRRAMKKSRTYFTDYPVAAGRNELGQYSKDTI